MQIAMTQCIWEAWWPSGRALDSGATGQGFYPHSGRRVVSLSKIHLPPKKVLVIPRKRWLHPDMTEKLLTGTKSLNPNKSYAYVLICCSEMTEAERQGSDKVSFRPPKVSAADFYNNTW